MSNKSFLDVNCNFLIHGLYNKKKKQKKKSYIKLNINLHLDEF